MNPGGKGANQAVAASRLGGEVYFIAKTGDDVFGRHTRQLFEEEGLHIDKLFIDKDNPSGVALINVDDHGENCIAVAPGSNNNLLVGDIEKAQKEILDAEIVLIQLEIPVETVLFTAELASKAGKKIILNPAPARELPENLYGMLYAITPNEAEAEFLTGVKVVDEASAGEAARKLKDRGVKAVVITMGSKGAFVFAGKSGRLEPVQVVKPVDTTAAGDVFNGALCVALSEGLNLISAVEFANKAAAISVTRKGAQASAPYRREMEKLLP
jgi:ribokinase